MWLLVLQGLRCEWGAGVLNLVLLLSLSHTGHPEVQHVTVMAKNSEDLKKRIVAQKMAKAIRDCQDPETELQHGGQDHPAV